MRVAGVGAQNCAGPRVEIVVAADEQVCLARAADLGFERALLSDGAVRCAGGEFDTQSRFDLFEPVDRQVHFGLDVVRRIGGHVEERGDGKVVRRAVGNGARRGEFASDEARVSE